MWHVSHCSSLSHAIVGRNYQRSRSSFSMRPLFQSHQTREMRYSYLWTYQPALYFDEVSQRCCLRNQARWMSLFCPDWESFACTSASSLATGCVPCHYWACHRRYPNYLGQDWRGLRFDRDAREHTHYNLNFMLRSRASQMAHLRQWSHACLTDCTYCLWTSRRWCRTKVTVFCDAFDVAGRCSCELGHVTKFSDV